MPHNNFLHSSCFNIPGAPEQLPAVIWLYIWLHRGLLKSPHLCLSTASRIHAVSISQLPLVSPQLLACTIIWVQYLDFCFSSQQLLAFILVLVSNFPSQREPTCLFLTNFLRSPGFNQYLHVPPFLSTPSCMHLVSISEFPPPCSGIHFRVPKILLASFSIFCMYLHVSSFRFNV